MANSQSDGTAMKARLDDAEARLCAARAEAMLYRGHAIASEVRWHAEEGDGALPMAVCLELMREAGASHGRAIAAELRTTLLQAWLMQREATSTPDGPQDMLHIETVGDDRARIAIGRRIVRATHGPDIVRPPFRSAPDAAGALLRYAFSPGGRWLVALRGNGATMLWDTAVDGSAGVQLHCMNSNTCGLREERPPTITFSPDDRFYLLADGPNLRLAHCERPDHSLPCGPARISKFSQDANYVLGEAKGQHLTIYRLDGPEPEAIDLDAGPPAEAQGRNTDVDPIAISGDGRFVAGYRAGTLVLWDLRTPTAPPRRYGIGAPNETRNVQVVFSHDATRFVTLIERRVTLWETGADGGQGTPLPAEMAGLTLAFSSDDRLLATLLSDRTARICDLGSASMPISSFKVPAYAFPSRRFSHIVTTLRFVSGDTMLETLLLSGPARAWHIATPHPPARVLRDGETILTSFSFSPDGRGLRASSHGGPERWWTIDDSDATPLVPLDVVPSGMELEFSLDGRTMLSGTPGEIVVIFPERSSTEPHAEDADLYGMELALLSSDGTFAVVLDHSCKVRFCRLAGANDQGSVPDQYPLLSDDEVAVHFDVSHDSRLVAILTSTRTWLWDVEDGAARVTLRETVLPGTRTVTFSPCSRWLALIDEDAVYVHELGGGRAINRLPESAATSFSHAFSPDGRQFAASCLDGIVRTWTIAPDEVPRLILRSAIGIAQSLSFSADCCRAVTVSETGVATLWHLGGSLPSALVLTGEGSDQHFCRFSPCGRWLAILQHGGIVLWPTPDDAELMRLARAACTRTLTEVERSRFGLERVEPG